MQYDILGSKINMYHSPLVFSYYVRFLLIM